MDNIYLEHIEGSPFIDKITGEHIAATGAGIPALGRKHLEVKRLFKVFVKKIYKILDEFANPQNPKNVARKLLSSKTSITNEERETIEYLKSLHDYILSPGWIRFMREPEIGGIPDEPDRTGKEPTHIKGAQLKKNISKLGKGAPAPSVNPPWTPPPYPPIKSMMVEIEMKYSPTATITLKRYIEDIAKAYYSFIRDARKATGKSKEEVEKIVSEIGIAGWRDFLRSIKQTIEHLPAKLGITLDLEEPTMAPPRPTTTSTGTTTRINIPSPQTTQFPRDPDLIDYISNLRIGGGKNIPDITKDDYANIILKVINIIIDAVKMDVARTEKYFVDPETGLPSRLPTTWQEPSILAKKPKVREEQDYDHDTGGPGSEESEESDIEIPSEFVYNFRSLLQKYPVYFIITLPIHNRDNGYYYSKSDGKLKKIEVLWENNKAKNTILVKLTDVRFSNPFDPFHSEEIPVSSPSITPIFRFYDHHVGSRSPYWKTFFVNPITNLPSIEQMLKMANPAGDYTLEGADPKIIAKINSRIDDLKRSLYAVTHRKSREFKRKPKDVLNLTADDEGNVIWHKGGGIKEFLTIYPEKYPDKPLLRDKIYSASPKEKETWRRSLEYIDYFKDFPEMKPIADTPEKNEAVVNLVAGGVYSKEDAKLVVGRAVEEIKSKDPARTDENITTEEILSWINVTKGKIAPETPSVPPEPEPEPEPEYDEETMKKLIDGAKALVTLGKVKTEKAGFEWSKTVWDSLGDEKYEMSFHDFLRQITKRLEPPPPIEEPPKSPPDLKESFINPFQKTNFFL